MILNIGHRAKAKIVSLGQKSKLKKTREKRFINHVGVVLWKKSLEKTPNIREMRRFWKSAIKQKLYSLQNSHLGSSVKIKKKTCEKRFFNHIRVVLCKKPLEKTPKIREMTRFWKSAIYSLCKTVSLGQKLNYQKTCEKRFFNHIRVVLCKKPLQKTSNNHYHFTIVSGGDWLWKPANFIGLCLC